MPEIIRVWRETRRRKMTKKNCGVISTKTLRFSQSDPIMSLASPLANPAVVREPLTGNKLRNGRGAKNAG